jgi:proline iminopeptidase
MNPLIKQLLAVFGPARLSRKEPPQEYGVVEARPAPRKEKVNDMRIIKTLGKIILGIVVGLVALFVLSYVLTMGQYPVAETVAQDPSVPNITIDGVTYHAEAFGDPTNPVVITIHGGPGADYKSILSLQDLADEYYVVFYDQRGTGLSPRVSAEELTLESSIEDLDSIVDLYGNGEKVDLVGHSWGAILASAYLGRHPEKVKHAVLAEPGALTAQDWEEFNEKVKIRLSPGVLYHFAKAKFESLHVKGPDDQASDDYFLQQIEMYQGSDHPQAGFRCGGGGPEAGQWWRHSATAGESILQSATDADGKWDVDLLEGVEGFTNKVLFIASECNTLIGAELQTRHLDLFPNAELAIIPDAGHEMFADNPEASITAVREYLNSPAQ